GYLPITAREDVPRRGLKPPTRVFSVHGAANCATQPLKNDKRDNGRRKPDAHYAKCVTAGQALRIVAAVCGHRIIRPTLIERRYKNFRGNSAALRKRRR